MMTLMSSIPGEPCARKSTKNGRDDERSVASRFFLPLDGRTERSLSKEMRVRSNGEGGIKSEESTS